MGLFGGVQVVGILCSIIRTKLVALWLGTVGVGLFGLFNNALEMLNTATTLGMRSSSVRDISQAHGSGNSTLIARIVTVVRRWSLLLGLGGALLTVSLAPLLSRITFGDSDHIWGFVALSAAVLLLALTGGEQAVLQGTARLKRLASATMWGTTVGLAVSIPLFYFLRERSVLPSIIAYALAGAIAMWLLRNREYKPQPVTTRETWDMGRGFIKLGIYMTLGNFATIVAAYVFNAWLNQEAGTGEVGLFQAGYTLVNKYTGLVLTALGMEYYPRLARVAKRPMFLRAFVSQELHITMMVMAPIIALFILLRGTIVWLLYSSDFQVIVTYVSWGMVGTVFRALSWCLAFVILARGDGRTYLVTETLSAVVGLALNILFYSQWGLNGLGMSFVVWYVVYCVIVGVVYFGRYRLRLFGHSVGSTAWTLLVAVVMLAAMECGYTSVAIGVTIGAVVIALWKLWRAWRR